MAQEKVTKMLDEERGLIALEATYGIDALVILMINALEDDAAQEVVWAAKEVLQRVKQLNRVIMSAIGDNEDNESLRKRA
jgi:hypothetical protein